MNSDFSGEEEVKQILDAWSDKSPGGKSSIFLAEDDGDRFQNGIAVGIQRNIMEDMKIMFRRHAVLIGGDPVLYLGRCVIILVAKSGLVLRLVEQLSGLTRPRCSWHHSRLLPVRRRLSFKRYFVYAIVRG